MLPLSKHCRRQNLAADRNIPTNRIYWRRQNVGVDKILVLTKCWHRQKYSRQQNVGIGKIFASTKCWSQQNVGVNKMLAQMQDPLNVWLGRVHSC
jgi:hypothetical protein